MSRFKEIIRNDEELNDLLWINYLDNKDNRIEIANSKFNQLFEGKITYDKEKNFESINALNKFVNFSTGNEKLALKLLKKYFEIIRENYNEIMKEIISESSFSKEEELYFKLNQKLSEKVNDIFDIEYEKMLRLSEVFDDVSLFSQVGWDLSLFSKEDLFNLSRLDDFILNKNKILDFLSILGKVNVENNVKKNASMKKPVYTNELLGINYGSDLTKLLPSELINLKNPYLKKLFYVKYIQEGLLNYSVFSKELDETTGFHTKRHEGPLIICIDTSSSMNGEPEEIAKSIVLFLLKKFIKIKRELYLISFGSVNQILELNLTNDKNGLKNALNFLKKSFSGGTDFMTPIQRVFTLISKEGFYNSNVLFITDRIRNIPNFMVDKINMNKEKFNLKIYSILLNTSKINLSFTDKILHYDIKNNYKFKGVLEVYDKMGHYEYLDKT